MSSPADLGPAPGPVGDRSLGELISEVTEDLERIKRSQEAVTQASHKLAEAMYRDAQAKSQPGPEGPQPGGAGEGNAAKGDVVDAEFEDLGEKK